MIIFFVSTEIGLLEFSLDCFQIETFNFYKYYIINLKNSIVVY